MSDILSAVGAALHADQQKLAQISLNAANATTPGYRRGVVSSVAFNDVMSAQEAGGTASGAPLLAPLLQRFTDFTQAGLQATGRPLDVAIEGQGLLMLTDGARTWLTRAGTLRINDQGELVGHKGLRVVGLQGDLRPVSAQSLSIDVAGRLTRGDEAIGQLRIVQPRDAQALSTQDGVLFEVEADQVVSAPPDEHTVRAGFLEGSNASGLNDMLGVMQTVRHFESLIRVAQGYDEVLGKAIQKLGEV